MTTKPKSIALSPVTSSQIAAVGHDGDTLAVQFKHGGLYHYHGVSAEQFADLKKSKSIGSHLHTHIKPHHKFTKQETQ